VEETLGVKHLYHAELIAVDSIYVDGTSPACRKLELRKAELLCQSLGGLQW
jgi:hypothetical protein